VTVVVGAIAAVLLALLSVATLFGVEQYAAVWAAAFLPIALAGYVIAHLMTSSKAFGRGVLAVALAALMTLTIRTGFNAAFNNEDTPVEMLVYTQTSPDLPKIGDRIDALAESSGLGFNLPIVVDNADSFAWPWAWYLRDYHDVGYVDIEGSYEPPPNAVLLISRGNTSLIDESLYSSAPYKHRWWFEETYRDLDFEDAARQVTSLPKLEALGRFFLHRRAAGGHTGSVDAVAYFPLTLSAFDTAPGPLADPRPPVTLADGRIVIGIGTGEAGSAPGEFRQPAGLFVDAGGNLWVADGLNNRVQKFDANGNFVAQIGSAGAAPGGLDEPWSAAVGPDGSVYVADTWRHRIQQFTADLTLVRTWGEPGVSEDDPLILFGPRDIAVAADGSLWVTDTGNNRLLHFTAGGQPIETIRGPGSGSFSEPVGVALTASGEILVADAWSGRILRFDAGPEHAFAGEIDAGWTSQDILNKPYVTVLNDGRILVSHPESRQLVLFDASGAAIGAWQPLQDSLPVGVAAMPDGGFAFSDPGRNEIQIVPASLVDGFFR
jgi:hypothetical protein